MTSSVLKYHKNDIYNDPIEVESLIDPRKQHACSIFYSLVHDGRPVAIVAGGLGGDSTPVPPEYLSDNAEIWDYTIEGSTWKSSKLICYLPNLCI